MFRRPVPRPAIVCLVALFLVLPTVPWAGALPAHTETADAIVPNAPRASRSVNCNPPVSGDWTISATTSCIGETLTIKGNVSIQSKLELVDTVLSFDTGSDLSKNITTTPGAQLYINGSTINTTSASKHFSLLVGTGVTFSMNDSLIERAGWKDLERWRGATGGAAKAEYDKYLWVEAAFTSDIAFTGSDGIEVRSKPLVFKGNTFRNCTQVRFFSNGNLVEKNVFEGMYHEGLAFMEATTDHEVRGNVFRNASRMNRDIIGLRFYPAVQRAKVYNNTFEWLPHGLMVANIPPWTSCWYMDIHNNVYRNIIFGVEANMRSSSVHHEVIDGFFRGISLDAARDTSIHHNRLVNATFQKDVENVIDRNYYNDVNGRGLLLNIAYWMWGFYCSKFYVNLGWYGRNLTVSDNYFANGPPYSLVVNSDQAQGMDDIKIINNTFVDIGNYIPPGYTVHEDFTGYNMMANQTPLSGASIMLEGSDHVLVEGNIFMRVMNGLVTSAPDALGNFGNFTVRNNLFRGIGTYSWNEQRYSGSWWSGSIKTTEDGVGIGSSMHYINGVGPGWSQWIWGTYLGSATQTIDNNTIYDFGFPVVLDFRRDQTQANQMGTKRAVVTNNILLRFIDTLQHVDFPNTIAYNWNVEEKVYPYAFPKRTVLDAHRNESSGRYYIVPGGMEFPDTVETGLTEWEEFKATAVGTAGQIEAIFSTDGGQSWSPVPANGSLAQASTSSNKIRFALNLTAPFRITKALQYDLNLTSVRNRPPVLTALTDITGKKYETAQLAADVTDPDGDTLALSWSQVSGPAQVTVANGTTKTAGFVPTISGVYTFLFEVSDGLVKVNDTMTVSVENHAPIVGASVPALAFKGEAVRLNGSGVDEDGDKLIFLWKQTVGPVAAIANNSSAVTTFVPNATGIYGFNLTVMDSETSAIVKGVTVVVIGRVPVAVLACVPASATEGDSVTLMGNASQDLDGKVVSYLFDFGDGSDSGWTNDSVVKHNYSAVGEFTAGLTVKDDDGNVSAPATVAVRIIRRLHPPVANISASPLNATVGIKVQFISMSSDLDGSIVKVRWDFGDGTNATGTPALHAYANVGTFAVMLTVTDNDNLTANASVSIVVGPRPNKVPVISTSSPTTDPSVKTGKEQVFSISPMDPDGDALSITWYIDGKVELRNQTGFTYKPTKAGTYKVRVEVTDLKSAPISKEWTLTVKKDKRNEGLLSLPLIIAIVAAVAACVAVAGFLVWRKQRGKGLEKAQTEAPETDTK